MTNLALRFLLLCPGNVMKHFRFLIYSQCLFVNIHWPQNSLVGGTIEDGKNHNKFLEINQKESINNQEIALSYLRLSNDLIIILHTPGQDS